MSDTFQRGSEFAIREALLNHIIYKATPSFSASGHTLAQLFGTAASVVKMGMAGRLAPDQQARWTAFQNWAQSGPNGYWAWCYYVMSYGDQLSNAVWTAAQGGSTWLSNPKEAAQAVLFASGSGLTDRQWYDVTSNVLEWVIKQIIAGTLNFNYLAVAVQGLLKDNRGDRKFPIWDTPPAFSPSDPLAGGGWALFLKQSGWNDIVRRWASSSLQTWAAQTTAMDSKLAALGVLKTTLDFASGKVLLDQITAKFAEYAASRERTRENIRKMNEVLRNPTMKPAVTAAQVARVQEAEKTFVDTDNAGYSRLNPLGMWPQGEAHGQAALGVWGAVQFAVIGGVTVVCLAILAWMLARMTEAESASAAVYEEVSGTINKMILDMRASCKRRLDAKEITEAEYQQCLAEAAKLTANLPSAPKGFFGGVSIAAMSVAAALGLGAVVLMSRKKGKKAAP